MPQSIKQQPASQVAAWSSHGSVSRETVQSGTTWSSSAAPALGAGQERRAPTGKHEDTVQPPVLPPSVQRVQGSSTARERGWANLRGLPRGCRELWVCRLERKDATNRR